MSYMKRLYTEIDEAVDAVVDTYNTTNTDTAEIKDIVLSVIESLIVNGILKKGEKL